MKASFFTFSGCCNSKNLSEDELDKTVRDPTRFVKQNLQPKLSTNSVTSTPDVPLLKPILKRTSSVGQIKSTITSKTVSFTSSDTEHFYEIESSNEPAGHMTFNGKFGHHTSKNVQLSIIGRVPFDYQLEDAETVDKIITEMDLPVEIVKLIKTHYSGLGNVRVTVLDLAGLVLFATYLHQPIEFFQSSNILEFFNEFLTAFPFSLPLIHAIKVENENGMATKAKALNGLFDMAFKNLLYYTIEAYYSIYGNDRTEEFIKESIKLGDFKLFKRFLQDKETILTDRIVLWSLKFGNDKVFQEFINLMGPYEKIKKNFKNPIIVHVAKRGFYFQGIVDLLYPFEQEHFNEALTVSITNGNHKTFRDLIKYDNSLFGKSHDPKILNVLRSIFNGENGNFVVEFESEKSLKDVFIILLMLDCNEPEIIEIFDKALKDLLIPCDYCEELLLTALFLKTRDYYKMILKACDKGVKLIYKAENGYLSIWDLIKDSRKYLEIMETLTMTDFHILYAIGNRAFPQVLWPRLIKKFEDQFRIPETKFKELSYKYGFNGDILDQSDLMALGLNEERVWSLLELAILNFNSKAVEILLEYFPILDFYEKESLLRLALNLKDLVESADYIQKHPMTTFFMKQTILDNYKVRKPDFYFDGVHPINGNQFVTRLREDIELIISLLN